MDGWVNGLIDRSIKHHLTIFVVYCYVIVALSLSLSLSSNGDDNILLLFGDEVIDIYGVPGEAVGPE